jgi:hypothetical protein
VEKGEGVRWGVRGLPGGEDDITENDCRYAE